MENFDIYSLFGFLMLSLLGIIYFLPTIIGWKKRNIASIMLLNLFLGWTFVGWVIAIVWAASHERPLPPQNPYR